MDNTAMALLKVIQVLRELNEAQQRILPATTYAHRAQVCDEAEEHIRQGEKS